MKKILKNKQIESLQDFLYMLLLITLVGVLLSMPVYFIACILLGGVYLIAYIITLIICIVYSFCEFTNNARL